MAIITYTQIHYSSLEALYFFFFLKNLYFLLSIHWCPAYVYFCEGVGNLGTGISYDLP